jgi:galactokinase
MGSHTDYNLGYVLTLPISRDTWIAARANGGREVRLFTANLEDGDCFTLDRIDRTAKKRWSNYVRGVAAVLQAEGLRLDGFDGVIHSTVPLESGLGSSAALECAAAVLFRALGGWRLEAEAIARLCQRAENEFVGVRCGILDQYSSCLGQEDCALLLDCRDLSTCPVPVAPGVQVVICDTRARRQLAGEEYALRRSQCEEGAARSGVAALRDIAIAELKANSARLRADVLKRCLFIVAENQRVLDLASALRCGDRVVMGRLCAESFAGAKDQFEICSPPMIAMMKAMQEAPGAIGARQAGAGFGGCMVALVEQDRVEEFSAAVSASYREATGACPEVYPVAAAPGAGPLCLPELASEYPVSDDQASWSRDCSRSRARGAGLDRAGSRR